MSILGFWTQLQCVGGGEGIPQCQKNSSRTSTGCSRIQLILMASTQRASYPTGWELSPTKWLHHRHLRSQSQARLAAELLIDWLQTNYSSGCRSQVQVVTCTLNQLATNQRAPQPPPHIPWICLRSWQNSQIFQLILENAGGSATPYTYLKIWV